ncbi:RdRP-domain-containing protein [Trametopsis cervina]|nr:RdRP-domain-containing protein [Trametopsis cervina]
MDWDDERFSRDEFQAHFDGLGILATHPMDDLLKRTTCDTRTGNEFGLKPVHLAIGTTDRSQFRQGFEAIVQREGVDMHSKTLPSSFWVRFKEECFQIRAFCEGNTATAYNPYKCQIPFSNVVRGGIKLRARYRTGDDQVTAELTIQSRCPPRYTLPLMKVLKIGKEAIYDRDATEADFYDEYSRAAEAYAGVIQSVDDDRSRVNPGLWLTHRLQFDFTPRQYKLLWMCMVRLRIVNLDPDFADPTATDLPPAPMIRWSSLVQETMSLSFPIRYLVEALITHNIVLLAEARQLIEALQRVRLDIQAAVLEGLFMWTRRSSIAVDLRDVARRLSPPRPIAEHYVVSRRCLVTPTRCLLMPPVLETSNSVLRRFSDFHDRFLRVQFVDDDGEFPVKGETLVIDDALYGAEGVFARVRRALDYGIHIAGRLYVFLTFGESQARAHGCWSISETEGFTVQAVLDSMGDLSRERVVAKHAARQSLALSSTRAVKLDVQITRGYPDIERNGYIFTDGVGQFTQAVADECARVVGHTSTPISAVQIRDGGVKGVLAVVNDPTLGEYEIRERNSMVKLVSSDRNVSVIKVASYSRATLNRQAILLLEALGVHTETLLDIFRAEKASIEEDGFDPQKLAAVTVFPLNSAFDHSITDDPFVEAVINVIKCRLLSDLKWKARIEIPESAFLMGIADETDSLNEGEIFCQIHPPGRNPQCITGPCTIYRNPCLHPGDVRRVKAVDCAPLRHLRNVIVFNTRGQRDLPNMLSGGDLCVIYLELAHFSLLTQHSDGDMYSLIWDQRLLIPPENVHRPMDYTAPVPKKCNSPVTIEQTKEHFINFMKNDVLGRVSNTHLALADQIGPRADDCILLAQLASQAVDFSKTGIPVSQSDIPPVKEYPDFMGKNYRSIRVFKKQPIRSYESMNALGIMFREIDPEPVFHPPDEDNWLGDPRLLEIQDPPWYVQYLEAAAKHKIRYDLEVEGLLRRYNISEAECAAGLLLRSPETRLKVEKDYDLRVALREAYALIVAGALERVDHHLNEHPSGMEPRLDRQAWAIAAYKITYSAEYAPYLDVDWTPEDMVIFEDNDGSEADAELHNLPPPPTRRFSFAWLLSEEIFALLEAHGKSNKPKVEIETHLFSM